MLDRTLREVNSDYDAKRTNNFILSPPVVRSAPVGLFYQWLKQADKLGGQHKVPRLCNDRRYMDQLLAIQESMYAEVIASRQQ